MTEIAFKQVDVFSNQRYHGNPLAVVLDASNLSTVQMQRIANWTNLSETTFVVPPTEAGADYQVRIFTEWYFGVFTVNIRSRCKNDFGFVVNAFLDYIAQHQIVFLQRSERISISRDLLRCKMNHCINFYIF